MSDFLGRIAVATPTPSGLTWGLVSDFGYGTAQSFPIITHRFGELATKAEQRYQVGIGPRKFRFQRARLSRTDRTTLMNFYEAVQGSYKTFTYNAPQPNTTTTPYSVLFENAPLSVAELANACQVGLNFIECSDSLSGPTYAISSTCLIGSLPDILKSALLSQVQQFIPLVRIRVRETAVSDIYVSDRRCTVGGIPYLPRILNLGEPGGDAIMSQDIKGTADSVQLVFGNADRAMTALANDTDLKYASIELSLYHVNTGILIQIWKGFVQGFVTDGSARFSMQCSDGLFQIMQQYPNRTISRRCWKSFNDGLNCPYSVHGSGGDPNQCDYTFSGTNGCASHGMSVYFGGIDVPQQMAVGHSGGNRVTNTSIVSDSMWGQALADIWCNQNNDLPGGADPLTQAFMVNAVMAVVRDQSGHLDSLGIIGAGPLGEYSIAPHFSGKFVTNPDGYTYLVTVTVDGFPPEGWKGNSSNTGGTNNPTGAPRQVVGNDPAATTEPFGLTGVGGTEPGSTFAAGVAFVEHIYQEADSTAKPSIPEQHTMQVPISKGLTGWVWDAGGTRTAVGGLTNPFWIAVNTYLRALGLQNATPDVQQQYFVLSSLVNVDGVSGAAQIADLQVANILGGGTSIQFQFQGTLNTQKPVRDWLTEIVACGLGYYTFEFGRLRFGCRINASAVEAFTLGNMLFQSLSLQPIDAAFEHLVISYADQAYQYQNNTGDYEDKDHSAYYGRSGSPLTARQNSVGCPTLNQALLLAVTRVREETGGVSRSNAYNNGTNIDPTEWRNARIATWKTTLLALNTSVGQVVSITHPDIPGGTGDFRIQNWKLNKDWSITITAKTVTPSMYNLDVGPKPADVKPPSLPPIVYAQPVGAQWAPYEIQAEVLDALFPSEFTFDVAETYTTLADLSALAQLSVTGRLPISAFIPSCGAPSVKAGAVSQSPTGGSIPGGSIVKVSLGTLDINGRSSPPSEILVIQIPTGTDTNQFTIHGVTWPVITGLNYYVVFASVQDDLICFQQSGSLIPGTPATAYTPVDITVTGPLARSTWAIPNNKIAKVRLKAKVLIHGGVEGAVADSVTSNTVVASQLADSSLTDNWTGRILASIGRNNDSAPFVAFNIAAFDAATGTFTIDRSPLGPGGALPGGSLFGEALFGAGGLRAGDAFVVCTLGVDNSANPLQIMDPGLSNSTDLDIDGNPAPHAGLVPSNPKYRGAILRVIKGTGRGQYRKIIDNGTTSFTVDSPLPIDSTSIWIVEYGTWQYSVDSTPVDNLYTDTSSSLLIPVSNFSKQSMLIGGFTVDEDGNESAEEDAPFRMIYIYGQRGSSSEGYYDVPIVSGHATPDLSKGLNQRVLMTEDLIIDAPINAPGPITWTLIVDQDTTGNWTASPDQTAYFNNFGLISGPNTRCQINWVLDLNGKNSVSGAPSIGQPTP